MTETTIKKRNVKCYLERALYALLLLFPFGVATVLAIGKIFTDPELRLYDAIIYGELTPSGMITIGLVILAFLAIMALLYFKKPKLLFVLVVIGCLIRVILPLMFYNNIFFSGDTQSVYEVSQGTAAPKHDEYWSFLPEWSNWSTFQRFLTFVFGFVPGSLIVMQSVMDCIIVFEIRALFMLITRNRPASNIAACIYAFMPSQVLYNLIFLPDITAGAFILGGVVLALKVLVDRECSVKRSLIISAVGGLLIGFGASFKPVGQVMCIALVIYCLIKLLNRDFNKRQALLKIGCALLVFVLAIVVPRVFHAVSEEVLDKPISNSAAPHYLNVGLNTETNGVFNTVGLPFTYIQQRFDGVPEDEAAAKAFELVFNHWKQDPSKVPALFASKIVTEWQYEGDPACFARNVIDGPYVEDGPAEQVRELFASYGAPSCHLYYIMLMGMACVGAVLVIIKSRRWSDALIMIGLTVVGLALLLLLSEAQSRYKSNAYPYITVISTFGLVGCFELLKRLGHMAAEKIRAKRGLETAGASALPPALDALSVEVNLEKQQEDEERKAICTVDQVEAEYRAKRADTLKTAVPGAAAQRLSIVVPCFNEVDNVEPMADALLDLFTGELAGYQPEIIFIDNASTDGTRQKLRSICAEHSEVRAILNARNAGIYNSIYHGLCQASGDAAVLIFCDFQEPVSLIPTFVHSWEDGYKIVCAIKTKSKENPVMRFLRTCYYKLIAKFSTVEQIEQFTGAGLYDKSFLEVMRALDDPTPFLKGIVSELGFNRLDIEYTQQKRRSGKTHSDFADLYDYSMLTFTTYTKTALRAITLIGAALTVVGVIWLIGLAITALMGTTVFDSRWILAFVVLFGAAGLFAIGLVGEYVMSANTRLMNRPLVVEEERLNF